MAHRSKHRLRKAMSMTWGDQEPGFDIVTAGTKQHCFHTRGIDGDTPSPQNEFSLPSIVIHPAPKSPGLVESTTGAHVYRGEFSRSPGSSVLSDNLHSIHGHKQQQCVTGLGQTDLGDSTAFSGRGTHHDGRNATVGDSFTALTKELSLKISPELGVHHNAVTDEPTAQFHQPNESRASWSRHESLHALELEYRDLCRQYDHPIPEGTNAPYQASPSETSSISGSSIYQQQLDNYNDDSETVIEDGVDREGGSQSIDGREHRRGLSPTGDDYNRSRAKTSGAISASAALHEHDNPSMVPTLLCSAGSFQYTNHPTAKTGEKHTREKHSTWRHDKVFKGSNSHAATDSRVRSAKSMVLKAKKSLQDLLG